MTTGKVHVCPTKMENSWRYEWNEDPPKNRAYERFKLNHALARSDRISQRSRCGISICCNAVVRKMALRHPAFYIVDAEAPHPAIETSQTILGYSTFLSSV